MQSSPSIESLKSSNRIPHARVRGNPGLAAHSSEGPNPEYYLQATRVSFMPKIHAISLGRPQGDARFAHVRTSCDPIAGTFLNGPSRCRFSCGRLIAIKAVHGASVFSSARGESRNQKSLPLNKKYPLGSGFAIAVFVCAPGLRTRMSFVVNLEKLADGGVCVALRGG